VFTAFIFWINYLQKLNTCQKWVPYTFFLNCPFATQHFWQKFIAGVVQSLLFENSFFPYYIVSNRWLFLWQNKTYFLISTISKTRGHCTNPKFPLSLFCSPFHAFSSPTFPSTSSLSSPYSRASPLPLPGVWHEWLRQTDCISAELEQSKAILRRQSGGVLYWLSESMSLSYTLFRNTARENCLQ